MKHLIITISREYGSGGSLIGRSIAETLGVPCYDRNALDKIAHERNIEKGYIPAWQERVSSPVIWAAHESSMRLFGLAQQKRHPDYYSNEHNMFLTQSKIIYELAEASPCVFVGRCADYVLKHKDCCLRVRICADEDSRALRAYNEYYERTASLHHTLRTVDRGRAAYYKRCTGMPWGHCQNYHLSLDSGAFGINGCCAAILAVTKAFCAEKCYEQAKPP